MNFLQIILGPVFVKGNKIASPIRIEMRLLDQLFINGTETELPSRLGEHFASKAFDCISNVFNVFLYIHTTDLFYVYIQCIISMYIYIDIQCIYFMCII